MQYLTTSAQISYFRNNGWIEFSDLLSKEEASKALFSCEKILHKRLSIPVTEIFHKDQKSLTMSARDLFRADIFLAKIVKRRMFAQIASQLTDTSFIRLAFDQVFLATKEENPFFSSQLPIEKHFCFQAPIGFLLVRLTDAKEETITSLPSKQGNAIFVHPEYPFDFNTLFSLSSQLFLLIGYADAKTQYIQNKEDLHTNSLKSLGYAFGDNLKEPMHPIVLH